MTEFRALGGLAISDNGSDAAIGGPRQRRLVAMLLIHRGAVVSVDRLADAVFAGEPTPAATGVQRVVLPGHEGGAVAVAFSPDGARLASVGADGLARVWAVDVQDLIDMATDRLTRTFSDDECRQYLHLDRCPEQAVNVQS